MGELEDRFELAAQFVGKQLDKHMDVSEEQQLTFYGLFKQAKQGDCTGPKPWAFNMVAAAKWKAWKKQEGLSSESAMQKYIDFLRSLHPAWEESSATPSTEEDAPSGNPGGLGGPIFSRPCNEEEGALEESEKTIFDYASEGNVDMVYDLLKKGDVDARDSEGRTPLHLAVDRGNLAMSRELIEIYHAPVNIQDMDGNTPLHFATLCEEEDLVKLLLEHKADATIVNEDGETSIELAEGTSVAELF